MSAIAATRANIARLECDLSMCGHTADEHLDRIKADLAALTEAVRSTRRESDVLRAALDRLR